VPACRPPCAGSTRAGTAPASANARRADARGGARSVRLAALAALLALLAVGSCARASAASVWLSEFLASNSGKQPNSLHDELGNSPDWIELYNAGPDAADLTGWSLTDNASKLTKWQFPQTVLPAQGYLVVFASGRDTNVAGQLHTNFKLAASGRYLGLVDAAGNVVSAFAPAYPPQQTDISYGRDSQDPSMAGYFAQPTPGGPNSTCSPGFGTPVQYSQTSGTFLNDFTLSLTTADTNCDIRYLVVTNNVPSGAAPLVNLPTSSSPLYTGPLPITNTAQVRARAFSRLAGFLPGPVHTENYVKLSPAAAAFTSTLPIMLFHNLGGGPVPMAAAEVRQAAILMVFEPVQGVASLTNPPALVTRVGLHTRGRITAGLPQWPLSLDFWDDYNGRNDQEFIGLPAESRWVLYPPDFIDLSLIRNPLIHQIGRDVGRYSPRTRFAECFFNTNGGTVAFSAPAGGDYFGFYTLEEKIKRGPNRVNITKLNPQNSTLPTVTGGYLLKIDSYGPTETTFYDSYSQNPIVFVDPPHRQMASPARLPQLHYISGYFAAFGAALWGPQYTNPSTGYAAYIDVDSWIDHHLLECFFQNVDAFRLSGFFYKDRGQRIEMGPMWDLHLTMQGLANQWNGGGTDFFNGTTTDNGVRWWPRLFTDPDFWQRWIDRWTALRSSVLTTTHIYSVMDGLGGQLTQAAPREAKRWGYGGQYQQQIASLKTWIASRFSFIDGTFLHPPVFSGNGGAITSGFPLTITAPTREAGSTIYYTLDGTDPRLPGGSVSPLAFSNLNSVTLTLTNNARVFARNWNPAHQNPTGPGNPPLSSSWSAPTVSTFVVAPPPLAITEIMCHPAPDSAGTNDSSQFEFIELENVGSNSLDLVGIRFTSGIDFTFAATNAITNLAPGQYLVLVRNPQVFLSRYPWVTNIAGQYSGTLNQPNEELCLEGALQEPILDFSFDPQWYPATDGAGLSLVIRNEYAPFYTWTNPASWRASSRPGGSPGQPDPPPPGLLPAVLVNEALSHPKAPAVDSIELYNPDAGPATIGGWFLTDNPKRPTKYCIPPGTVIPPGGYVVFDRNQFDNNGPNSFALSSLGDGAYLFSGDGTNLTGYGHGFKFGAQLKGVSFGRYVTSDGREHFVAQRDNTLGATNSYPQVGPVVINELMYSPPPFGLAPDTQDEFLELRNFSSQTVPLFDPDYPTNAWALDGAIQFAFPPGVSMPPRSYALVVSFDPAQDPARLSWFQQHYGVAPGTPVFGPYQGTLADEAPGVGLYQPGKPVAPPSALAGSVPQVLVEEVHYSSLPPWPAGASQSGCSLQRLASVAFADDPANWLAGPPTPGAINDDAFLADTDHDGMPDELELLAGTDPLNPSDFLRLDQVSIRDAYCVLQFTAHAGHTYAIEKADQLGSTNLWTVLQGQIPGVDGPITVVDPLTPASRFYRLSVTAN
jgi:hypothetical protein